MYPAMMHEICASGAYKAAVMNIIKGACTINRQNNSWLQFWLNSDLQLQTIFDSYIPGFAGFDRLEKFRDVQLIQTALADISAVVDHLL